MELISTYFFDTYALIAIIKGNSNYDKYSDKTVITTKLNLMELYSALLRDFNEKKAEHYYKFYAPSCIEIDDYIIKESVKLWHMLRKLRKKPSYIDCIGYVIAKRLGIKFLTGDNQFKTMSNVEFVK